MVEAEILLSYRRNGRPWQWVTCALVATLTAIVLGCGGPTSTPATVHVDEAPADGVAPAGGGESSAVASIPSTDVGALVAREELILHLTPLLARLDRSILNLKLPDHDGVGLFADRIKFVDLSRDAKLEDIAELPGVAATTRRWPIPSGKQTKGVEQFELWRSLLSSVRYFQHAHFYFIRGDFVDGKLDKFDALLGFSGLARTDVTWRAVRAKQRVTWQRDTNSPGAPQSWRITQWQQEELTTTDSERRLFAEILDQALPRDLDRRRARESLHRHYLVNHYYPRIKTKLPGDYRDNRFFPIATATHPGLSVVDIDRDGFDDLYVTVRWGKNMLLRNRGDGTFEEIAGQLGLDVEGRCNAALFADYDNDGDVDLMLARSLEPSLYLVNEDGRFVDRSKSAVAVPLPYLASSVSAADYNGDGLLDVYFSTYLIEDISSRLDVDLSRPQHWIHGVLTEDQSRDLAEIFKREHKSFVRQVGPPNLLLINRGDGRFDAAPETRQVAGWRNAFQATWADYDRDGDPDLYVSNDFAPDHLYRNDGPAGFINATGEAGVDIIGFGMGVSWGDYDNDGRLDLYVTNMYSKAGMRVTRQLPGISSEIPKLADGNYLYRNLGDRFKRVSGIAPPALAVARAGWAWGGQFVDVDNDGYQDIYVTSGYHTVPDEFATDIDL